MFIKEPRYASNAVGARDIAVFFSFDRVMHGKLFFGLLFVSAFGNVADSIAAIVFAKRLQMLN